MYCVAKSQAVSFHPMPDLEISESRLEVWQYTPTAHAEISKDGPVPTEARWSFSPSSFSHDNDARDSQNKLYVISGLAEWRDDSI